MKAWWGRRSGRTRATIVAAVVVLGLAAASSSRELPGVSPTPQTAANPSLTARAPSPTRASPAPTPAEIAPVEPTPSPTPIFGEIPLSGKGSKVAKFSIPSGSIPIAVVSHRGKSNFAIESIDASGSTIDLLVNTIGNYDGTVLFGVGEEPPVAFQVTADGTWKITIRPATDAPIWDRSKVLEGTGDSVYLISPPGSGLVTLDLTFKGDSNFAVTSYGPNGTDLLVNEIGDFTGQVLLPDRAVILEVIADGGAWTATAG